MSLQVKFQFSGLKLFGHHVPSSSDSCNSCYSYPSSPSPPALNDVCNMQPRDACAGDHLFPFLISYFPLLHISPPNEKKRKVGLPSSYPSGSFFGFFLRISMIFLPLKEISLRNESNGENNHGDEPLMTDRLTSVLFRPARGGRILGFQPGFQVRG